MPLFALFAWEVNTEVWKPVSIPSTLDFEKEVTFAFPVSITDLPYGKQYNTNQSFVGHVLFILAQHPYHEWRGFPTPMLSVNHISTPADGTW